jgi:integrase
MGFRIGDALKLRVSQICGTGKKVKNHIEVKEQKTEKVVTRPIPPEIKQALQEYIDSLRWEKGGVKFQSYLFESERKPGKHYCKEWVNNRLKIAAAACGIEQRVTTHTMRKTFAYWTYMTHKDNRQEFATERECLEFISASVMRHSSAKVTLRYIGLEQEKVERITGKAIVK